MKPIYDTPYMPENNYIEHVWNVLKNIYKWKKLITSLREDSF